MGRAPCCDKANVKKGPWSPEEDLKLKEYIEKHGNGGNWIALPQKAGLKRCGKSCRLRWLNYLRPNIKHGEFTDEEETIICSLFANIGSRWSIIAAQLPGRTDNDIKNYWNTKLKKKLLAMAPHHNQSQRKPPLFPSSHHNPSSFASLLYKECATTSCPNYYPTNFKSFNGFEPIFNPLPSDHHSSSLFQTQDCFLSFGSEASCSSNSDGSCGHQISYGSREIKQEDISQMIINNGYEDQNQKFVLSYGHQDLNQWAQKPDGYNLEGTPLLMENHDAVLQNVKQLIGSDNQNLQILDNDHDQENKTENKFMYQYCYY